MVLRTLFGCSPFIACGLISSFTQWRIGTLVAVTLSVVLLIVAVLERRGMEGAVLEASAVVFCGVALIIAFSRPEAGIRDFIGALSTGWLALTAWLSVAIGRPFTKHAERRRVSASLWRHPGFHRAHVVITSVWAVAFTETAIALCVLEYEAPHSGLVEVIIQIVGNFVPAVIAYRLQAGRRGAQARPEEAVA
jgi:hypothetical protein